MRRTKHPEGLSPELFYRYQEQQEFLDMLASKHGFVCFRPDYHAKTVDRNTVLLYTVEDAKHNREVDRQPTHYTRGEAADLSRAWKQTIDDKYVYRDAFWTFENTDRNGMFNYDYANHGTVDLHGTKDWQERLEGAIMFAFTRKKLNGYIGASGGPLALREADQTNNDYNRDLIRYFRMKHGQAFMGNVNYYDEKREQIVKGEGSIYTEYTGQQVYNFEYSFVVPCQDVELENLIRRWNGDERLPKNPVDVAAITDRVTKLGGIHLIWY